MAEEQIIVSSLCDYFINLKLGYRPDLRNTHADRIYQDVNVPEPNDLVFPYIYWSGRMRKVSQRTSDRKWIGKLTSTYDVRSVRRYPQGGANWSDFDGSQNELRNALTGIPCTPIIVDGRTLGNVFQSRYLTDFEQSYKLDGLKVLEKGITIEIIHK